ncbi:hypothetical protein W97_08332 [Coniosporium apollinis CBS 100218]|uniref:SGNH hydrolase-type esterase domain-containing protein n=1 Tax=Coniosporium apollinis (strain CBS 100218) TaxID=1168221 RepID=R7Z5G5_CONA1|nr:uncharacterized protein W97_08332 [Coniosporium apollinis CBS 100218]EON69146.1 hypothetical protein W97_08332 [Coniosporium apollinis CBS 100218]
MLGKLLVSTCLVLQLTTALGILPRFNAPPLDAAFAHHRDAENIRYAAFGDSWASGVNYGPPNADLEYDSPNNEELCRCRRVNEAYPVQLRDDRNISWANGKKPDLDFVACHGAFFDAIPDQVRRLNQSVTPRFATLMIGGNNGGFPDIIENCIYQPKRDKDYGPEYPDPSGECFKALQRARCAVTSWTFVKGIRNSINAVLDESRIKRDTNFRLYVLGYADLFNHDDRACDDWSFGVWPGKQQKLSTVLRKDINLVIDAGRFLYDKLINRVLHNSKVRYIDINAAFAKHRFCEPTEEGTLAAQAANSWLWSLEWTGCIPLAQQSAVQQTPLMSESWPEFCRKCGDLGQLGEVQRPFHPKPEGHKAIKDALTAVLKSEGWIAEDGSGLV